MTEKHKSVDPLRWKVQAVKEYEKILQKAKWSRSDLQYLLNMEIVNMMFHDKTQKNEK